MEKTKVGKRGLNKGRCGRNLYVKIADSGGKGRRNERIRKVACSLLKERGKVTHRKN